MSKPIARVVLAVLISLGIIAVVFTSAQARLGSMLRKAEANNANAYMSAGGQSLGRANMSARVHTYYQYDAPDSSHNCDSSPDPFLDD
ncbi:MAG: hypothetical protein HZB19_07015 [Chloroflexi bacterium]|nr:hypothetical protein [Chloroflexota bacterium]